MTKCGKGCMPECEYFTTGGCVSPFNCSYKAENESITTGTPCNLYVSETDKDKQIARLTAENERLQTENAKIDEYRCVIDDISEQCRELEAENAELRATLSKMETIEKELRARLKKAVELPRIIHPNKSEWHIQYQYESGIIDSDIRFFIEAAEARLKELQGGKNAD